MLTERQFSQGPPPKELEDLWLFPAWFARGSLILLWGFLFYASVNSSFPQVSLVESDPILNYPSDTVLRTCENVNDECLYFIIPELIIESPVNYNPFCWIVRSKNEAQAILTAK